MSSSHCIPKVYSNSCQQYLVSTTNSNINQTSGRVIIAKSHPPNLNSDMNNHLGGPIQFQFNSTDGTLYTGNNSFFQSHSNNVSSDICSGNVYSYNGSYLDNMCQPLTHTTRASPSTVEWLVENFEPGEGCSLRRSTLYSYYIQDCSRQKLESVNPASFGKLIRSVFLGLKTRRLGTRGNSKYHYYGIRIKQNSPLIISNDQDQQLHYKQKTSNDQSKNSKWKIENDDDDDQSSSEFVNNSHLSKRFVEENNSFIINETISIDPSIENNIQLIQIFQNSYQNHCQKLYDVITRLDFDSVEQIWLNYWSSKEYNSIYSLNNVQNFIMNCDYQLYESIIQKLIPDILSPIPGPITQSIRRFGKNVDNYLNKCLIDVEERIKGIKLIIANGFSMTLRRYTSLNHLAQSARSVLTNSGQVNQMFEDLNKVDFVNVQEQGWWICQCDENIVSKIEKEFKINLSNEYKLEEWCQWIELLINDLFKPYLNLEEDRFVKRGKDILLNWSFYCSIIIRDLTLRSATSFGSFHLIRLLFDEYLFYLIELKIARHTKTSSIAHFTKGKIANLFSIRDCLNPSNICDQQTNIPSKISVLLKKDSLSQAKIFKFPSGNVQLPIFNKLVSTTKLSNEINNNSNSVKRFKTSEEMIIV